MPYTNLFFLTQVASTAWDGCAFFLNLDTIVSADIRGLPTCTKKKFVNLPNGIGRFVAFHEYSPAYPHEAMTLGLPGLASGGPAGDSFYISLTNNTLAHGPRGPRPPGAIPKNVDPCTGRVVAGFHVLTRLARVSVRGGDTEKHLFKDLVIIKKGRLVEQDEASIIVAKDSSSYEPPPPTAS